VGVGEIRRKSSDDSSQKKQLRFSDQEKLHALAIASSNGENDEFE